MRKAFVMQLKKGCEAEYQKRHNEIWPELKALLSESGVFDYTIFLERETENSLHSSRSRARQAPRVWVETP
jgi:L-rhamnose mutarotase